MSRTTCASVLLAVLVAVMGIPGTSGIANASEAPANPAGGCGPKFVQLLDVLPFEYDPADGTFVVVADSGERVIVNTTNCTVSGESTRDVRTQRIGYQFDEYGDTAFFAGGDEDDVLGCTGDSAVLNDDLTVTIHCTSGGEKPTGGRS